MNSNIKLVLFSGEGRLGNQLIQIAALRMLYPNAYIAAIGCKQAIQLLEPQRIGLGIKSKYFEKFIRKIVFPLLLTPIAKHLRIFHYCRERSVNRPQNEEFTGDPIMKQGLLPICIAEKMYFQNFTSLLDKESFKNLKINENLTKTQEKSNPIPHKSLTIHIRRGDYLNFTTHGLSNLTLDEGYYRSAIKHFYNLTSATIEKTYIITDDINWCKEKFSDIKDIEYRSSNELADFIFIASSENIICSNSTFSLTASLLSEVNAITIAPEYWLGHNHKVWIPTQIKIRDPRYIYV
ncbi:alpha-1,2-fucosyltransferase [Burkholderiaceae bacterium DAT-1]|nr:alpha-1,2-fucosyltransferase [Burkholderiaceae bacterium DAT-1]